MVRHVLAIAVLLLAAAGCADDDPPPPTSKSEPTSTGSPGSTVTRSWNAGTVKWFDPVKGTGIITPDDGSGDLPVHSSEIFIEGGSKVLRDGQRVSFDRVNGSRGPTAVNVRPVDG